MNISEHLLTCLIEECSEIQQAASKALRFGLDDGHPEKTTTNAEDIAKECVDLVAVIEMLEEAGIIDRIRTLQGIEHKKAKVRHYMGYAKRRGTLVDVVTCGQCRKIMTTDCPLCSFEPDGHCTGRPDDNEYCFMGVR